jgi:hypothetical protein
LNAAVEEGREAKHRLVTSNLRMVQGVVNLYIRNGLGSQYNAGDLMQDGTAVSRHDENLVNCIDPRTRLTHLVYFYIGIDSSS